MKIHLIGVCGTAMATLAAMLKQRGFDVQGSDQDVYPPMSDFLAAEGIRAFERLSRRAHHRRPRPRRRRQRDLARQPRARGGARSEDPLLLAARGDSRALPLGRAVDRHRRHARQDDDDVADRLAADARRASIRRVLVGGIARNFGDARLELSPRPGARLRHRRRRVRQRVLRQDGEVPEVPARHRRHQQHRVRPRRHLRRPRRRDAGVPAARRTWCRGRGLLLLGADSPHAAGAEGRAPCRRSRRSASATTPTGRRTISSRRRASTRFTVRRGGAPFGAFELPLLGAHNVRNALAAIAVGDRRRASSAERIAEGPASVRGRQAAARDRRRRRRRDGLRRFRASSDGRGRDARRRCARRIPAARIWAVFEPRSASSCRRVFQDDFARAFGAAPTKCSSRRCSDRRCRKPSGCRWTNSSPISNAAGRRARHVERRRRHRRHHRRRADSTATSW